MEDDKSENESDDTGLPINFPFNPFAFLNNLGDLMDHESDSEDSESDESSDDMQDWWKRLLYCL